MVTWFYGVCAWVCVCTACMCSKNTASSEEENERMLKRWIQTNGPDSISVPLQHEDSCANRHETKCRIMPEKKEQVHTSKFASFVLRLWLVSYLKSGREIHPNASVFCSGKVSKYADASGSSQPPHYEGIGRTGHAQAHCVLFSLYQWPPNTTTCEQHMLKHCWHEDRAETKNKLT